jgi:hypothetical protein
VLYWYTTSIFRTDDGFEKKWSKISVIKYTQDPQEIRLVEEQLFPIAEEIAKYWRPITSWSWISLTIARNGLTIITLLVIMIISVLVVNFYFEITKINSSRHLYSQISDSDERNIIESIKLLEKEIASEKRIISKFKELTGKNIEKDKLNKKILEAEELNIIKRKIVNIDDEPYLTWITQFN